MNDPTVDFQCLTQLFELSVQVVEEADVDSNYVPNGSETSILSDSEDHDAQQEDNSLTNQKYGRNRSSFAKTCDICG